MKIKKLCLVVGIFLFMGVLNVGIDQANYAARADDNCACEDGTYECECSEDGYTYEEYSNDYDTMSDEEFCEVYPDECVDDTSENSSITADDYAYDGDPDVETGTVTTYDSNGTSSTSDCDASDSCWFYNCCDSVGSTSTTIISTVEEYLTPSKKTTTTKSVTLSDGSTVTLPADTTVDSSGLATTSDGTSYELSADSIASILGLSGGSSGTKKSSGISAVKCGAGFTPMGGVCFPNNTGLSNASVYAILSNILAWLMGLFTTFAVGAFVVSGIQYLMAAGDESLAESAKKNATYAVLGIIVGLSSFIIIKAIATALSGTSYFF